MASSPQMSDGAQTLRTINVTQADSPYTLDRNLCPCLITNIGATGACIVNLPQDAKGGEEVYAKVCAAQDITLAPGAAGAVYGDDGTAFAKQTDDKNITGDAVGEGIHLVANENNDWIAENQSVGTAIAGSFSEVEA